MAHKVTSMPKIAAKFHEDTPLSEICELHWNDEEDTSPCSHFNHCERRATIWLYDKEGMPKCYGLCNQCYNWTHPTNEYWYRVVKVSPEFSGTL